MNEFDKLFSDLFNNKYRIDTKNTFTYDNIKDMGFDIASIEAEEMNKHKKNIDNILNEIFFTKTNSCYLKLSAGAMLEVINVLFDKRLDFSFDVPVMTPFSIPTFKDILMEQFMELIVCTDQDRDIVRYFDVTTKIMAIFLSAEIPCTQLRSGYMKEHDISIDDVLNRRTRQGNDIYNQLKNSGVDLENLRNDIDRNDNFQHRLKTVTCITNNSYMLSFTEGDYSDYIQIKYLTNTHEHDDNIFLLTVHFRTKTGYENFIRSKKKSLYDVFKKLPEYTKDIIKFFISDVYKS